MPGQKLTKYQIWYRENRERIAKKRRKRYRSDTEYRERSLQACRDWRARTRPWEQRTPAPRQYLLISEFANEVGCSPETLRNLERHKLIPRTTNGTARRRYHPANVSLVTRLVDFRKDTHYSDPKYDVKLKALVSKIKASWQKV